MQKRILLLIHIFMGYHAVSAAALAYEGSRQSVIEGEILYYGFVKGLQEGEAISIVFSGKNKSALIESIISLLKSSSLSLPEKEAICFLEGDGVQRFIFAVDLGFSISKKIKNHCDYKKFEDFFLSGSDTMKYAVGYAVEQVFAPLRVLNFFPFIPSLFRYYVLKQATESFFDIALEEIARVNRE